MSLDTGGGSNEVRIIPVEFIEINVEPILVDTRVFVPGYGGVPSQCTNVMTDSVSEQCLRLWQQLQAGDEELMGHLFPFLVAEMHYILEKDEDALTPAERPYVEVFSELPGL